MKPSKKVTERKTTESGATARKVNPKLITTIILSLFFAVALFLRVYLPYNQVFTNVGIKFTSNDTYFFMRLVDNLVYNFPLHTAADPYISYPGTGAFGINFFTWLLAVPAWIIGLGSPSQHTIDVVSVYLPAVMGALTVIPVYFIGRELFSRWAGVLSAGLIAILPGEFLGRSILGFTDNHVAETLFTAVTMLLLMLAIKAASQRQLTFSHLKHRDWAVIKKPLVYGLLAAISMGIYIFTWLGALLFVFITFLFFVIQFIIDHLKHKDTDYLCFVGVIFFFVTLIMALMISSSMLYIASLVIATFAIIVLNGLSRLMANRKLMIAYYPLALLGLAGAALGLLYLVDRPLFNSMVSAFSLFRPSGAQLTTIEMQPLISPIYGNPFAIAWGNFNVSFFFSFISLIILLYLLIKEGKAEKSLLLVWSLVILVATLGQRRFGYYLAVNVALLTGYLCWKALELAIKGLSTESAGAARRAAARRARQRVGFSLTVNHAVIALAVLVIFFGVFFWNIEPAIAVASSAPYAPSDAWVTSLTWLKDNSPEPLGSKDAYYQIYPAPPVGANFTYPESAYGVMAWWDYGYWITRIAHRIPNVNPSQDRQAQIKVASFFTSQDESSAAEIRRELNSAYVIIDHETTLSKFWAIITWAGKDTAKFFDSYLVQQQDKTLRQVILYYPDYYRSMAVRMFNFDGKAVTPDTILVISYSENKNQAGQAYKIVTGVNQFATYQEAEVFLSSQQSGNYKIVGSSPMKSPVPLEALERYRLVKSSDNYTISLQDGTSIPSVKIFEYVK